MVEAATVAMAEHDLNRNVAFVKSEVPYVVSSLVSSGAAGAAHAAMEAAAAVLDFGVRACENEAGGGDADVADDDVIEVRPVAASRVREVIILDSDDEVEDEAEDEVDRGGAAGSGEGGGGGGGGGGDGGGDGGGG
eukprot:5329222-Pleurochrysis_carterae.AAC.1